MRPYVHQRYSRCRLLKRETRGFSLVELLVIIAIIGVMASVAIPMMTQVRRTSMIAQAKRNAQHAAFLLSSAKAAGATFVDANVGTMLDALDDGINGAGSSAEMIFRLPGISTAEAQASDSRFRPSTYLAVDPNSGELEYLGRDIAE